MQALTSGRVGVSALAVDLQGEGAPSKRDPSGSAFDEYRVSVDETVDRLVDSFVGKVLVLDFVADGIQLVARHMSVRAKDHSSATGG